MEKSVFEKDFADTLNQNFDKYSEYFNLSYKVFHDLRTSVFEISKCLILEFNKAAITLTNHMLERLLKLALIYNEVGIGPKPVENWNQIFDGPVKKYEGLGMQKAIEKCEQEGLIVNSEKTFLDETIRDTFRNAFSHAQHSKILDGVPGPLPLYSGSFGAPGELKEVRLNGQSIPVFQSVMVDDFAKQNAGDYFRTVIVLLINIEERMVRKSFNLPD